MKSYIHVRMMDKHVKCGQDFTNSLHRGRWVFVPTQVDHYPRHIPEKSDWDVWTDKGQQGLYHTQLNDIISQMRSVTNDVTYIGFKKNKARINTRLVW